MFDYAVPSPIGIFLWKRDVCGFKERGLTQSLYVVFLMVGWLEYLAQYCSGAPFSGADCRSIFAMASGSGALVGLSFWQPGVLVWGHFG